MDQTCSNCGTTLRPGTKFCPNCGQLVPQADGTEVSREQFQDLPTIGYNTLPPDAAPPGGASTGPSGSQPPQPSPPPPDVPTPNYTPPPPPGAQPDFVSAPPPGGQTGFTPAPPPGQYTTGTVTPAPRSNRRRNLILGCGAASLLTCVAGVALVVLLISRFGRYSEDFSQPSDVWIQSETEQGSRSYVNGAYRITAKTPGISIPSLAGNEFKDIRLDVDARQTAGGQGDLYGLMCRVKDTQNFYAFVVNSGGEYSIEKMINGSSTTIAEGTSDDAIRGDLNHLRADCKGNNLTLYANDKQLVSAPDSTFTTGKVGMLVQSSTQESASVDFDNISWRKP